MEAVKLVPTPKTLMPFCISIFLTSPAQAHTFEQEVLRHWREREGDSSPLQKTLKRCIFVSHDEAW